MRKETVPLQHDMFSGGLVDTRSSYQKRLDTERQNPHQMTMFSAQVMIECAGNARPWLYHIPVSPLVLEAQDLRTPEEIECELLRQAEGLTGMLFADQPELYNLTKTTQDDSVTSSEKENSEAICLPHEQDSTTSKLDVYLMLVNIICEQTTTIWVDKAYQQRFLNQLPMALFVAGRAGLISAEIANAMQIGEFLGNREKQEAKSVQGKETLDVVGQPNGLRTRPVVGFRARAREAGVNLQHR